MKTFKQFGILMIIAIGCSNQKTEMLSKEKKLVEAAIDSIAPNPVIKVPHTSPSSASSKLVVRNVLGKVEVLVPRTFNLMEADMIAVKYPLKKEAIFQVYTDEEATINIAFEHLPNRATPQDLLAIKKVLEQQFNQPGIDLKKSEIGKINDRDFVVIEMITQALDTEVYNLMVVTSLEGRLLMGTFNCTLDKLQQWQATGHQIMNSIKIKD